MEFVRAGPWRHRLPSSPTLSGRYDRSGTPAASGAPLRRAMQYDAFVSYSHAADGKLAPALEAAVERFAKPWHRRRALHLFRDQTSLALTPELWPEIERALAASRFFLLLASPEAARSPWVAQEVGWWLAHKSTDSLLIVLTGGDLAWDHGV